MSRYETDEEQWEAIKRWWKENGTQVILAVVVAIAATAGWRYYQGVQYARAAQASSTFEVLKLQAQLGKFDEVAREAHKLMTEQPDSPYAAGAALLLAQWHYEKKHQLKEALEALQWVTTRAQEPGMKMVAQVRGARMLADAGQYDKAEQWLKPVEKDALALETRSLYDYVQGEIALFRQDVPAARAAFQRVVDNGRAHEGLLQLAKLQLKDLAEEK